MFDYTKPGKGVDKDQPEKRSFSLFFEVFTRRFWKLLTLNLIFFVCCIPVVTIGPALAGLFYVLRNFSRRQHAFVWMDFKDAVKTNWKKATAVFFINSAVWLALFFALYFYWAMSAESVIMTVALAITFAFAFLFAFMNFYLYTMLVTFDLSLKKLYKNAFLLSFLGLLKNFLTLLVFGVLGALLVIGLLYLWTIGGMALVLFALTVLGISCLFSFSGYVISFITYPVIKKYLITPFYDSDRPQSEQGSDEVEAIFEDNRKIR